MNGAQRVSEEGRVNGELVNSNVCKPCKRAFRKSLWRIFADANRQNGRMLFFLFVCKKMTSVLILVVMEDDFGDIYKNY